MESAATGLLDSVVYKTLHAQSFNRSSTKASNVLTDLLSRYLSLLAATCARYAEHAGRTSVAAMDAVNALDELGVSLDELSDFAGMEGRELVRYSSCTTRRLEELALLKDALEEGRRLDRDDAVHLVYGRVPEDIDESEEEEERDDRMDEDVVNHINGDVVTKEDIRMMSPILPPSPVSRPVSPSRKRPRLCSWNPPPHVPDFLPPFPSAARNGSTSRPPSPIPMERSESEALASTPADNAEHDRVPNVLPQQLSTAASAADYLTPVPYNMSSLSSAHESHLPDRQRLQRSLTETGTALQLQPRKHAVSEVTPALMGAYHHLLTNPPPKAPSTNPNRHRVALSMMAQSYISPRWTPSDTLFANIAAPKARVLAPGPTFPVSLDGKKDEPLPVLPSASKAIGPTETLVPLNSQPSSRVPALSKAILPPAVLFRASRLQPPPPLINSTSGEKFLYGTGIPAPWNANQLSQSVGAATAPSKEKGSKGKGKNKSGGDEDDMDHAGVKDRVKNESVISDAMFLATWDWEVHDYRLPPVHAKKVRGLGSFSLGGSSVDGDGLCVRRNAVKPGRAK